MLFIKLKNQVCRYHRDDNTIRETNAKSFTQIKYMQRAWILVTSRMEADNDLFQFSRNHQRSEEPIFRWRGKKHWFKIKSFGCNLQFTFKEQARFHEDFNHCYKDKVKLSTRFIWTENTIIAWTVERNCQNRCIYYVLHLMRLVID